jgi:hypothetical protein
VVDQQQEMKLEMGVESKEEEMARERALVPGSEAWADAEARLFEVLFMREWMALLPSHWSVDFRGIPTPSLLFASGERHKPVIYSLLDNDSQGFPSLPLSQAR